MSRLTPENVELAAEIIGRYPRPKSALIPLLHLAQEQNGYVTEASMAHIAELVGISAAEVLGTCTFYEMFKLHPVGTYVINVCTNISCMLTGGEELLHHAEKTLGIKAGNTTTDGLFTLEEVECIAACTESPALQVNYRYCHKVSNADFEQLVSDLRGGHRTDIPPHGTLALVRQHIPADRSAGVALPEVNVEPVWMAAPKPAAADGGAS